MDCSELKKIWVEEENRVFSGWDFSYLDGRWHEEELPWDYKETVYQYLKGTDKLLDIGTGGGEFLLSLGHPYRLTCATESYPPNVELCKKELAPLGIDIREIFDDRQVPFADNAFEIIINRHESFEPKEVRRLLKKNGIFITQQVGGENNRGLSEKLIDGFAPKFPNHNLEANVKLLKENGFEVLLSKEAYIKLRFFDIGAVVYFAKIIEWEFPDFSVEKCFDNIYKLYQEWRESGYIESIEHRFIIAARKL